jgi:hypothetical protein
MATAKVDREAKKYRRTQTFQFVGKIHKLNYFTGPYVQILKIVYSNQLNLQEKVKTLLHGWGRKILPHGSRTPNCKSRSSIIGDNLQPQIPLNII